MSKITDKEKELKLAGYKYLGYENGFYQNPPTEFKECKHPKSSLSDNRGEHVHWCSECKFYFNVDSSD